VMVVVAVVTLLGIVGLAPQHLAWPALLVIGLVLNTLEVSLAYSAPTVRVFDSRVLMVRAASMVLAGPILLALAGPTWLVPILLTTAMVSAATHLSPRMVGTLLVFTSATYLAMSGAIDAGVVTVVQPTQVGGSVSLPWAAVVAAVFLPGATLFSVARAWADERKRRALQASLNELRATEDDLRSSQQAAEQASARLAVEVERKTHELERRNRSLSIVNAVSFALSEPVEDDHAIRRAARLIARLLGVRSVEVREAASETAEAASVVVGPNADDAELLRLPGDLIDEVARSGESILAVSDPEQLAAVGVDQAYVIVPMVTQGHVRGALTLIGDVTREWSDEERHLLTLIGRELGAATESGRLYREAVARAEREELVTRVSAEVAGADELEQQLARVLSLLGETLGPAAAAIIRLPMDAPDGGELVRWLRSNEELAISGAGFDQALDEIVRAAGEIHSPRLIEAGDAPLAGSESEIGALIVVPLLTRAVADDRDQANGDDAPVRATQSVTGLLVVAAPAGWSWPSEDVALVERLGRVIARRLDAEQLVQLQQRRLEEMAGLAEIGRVVQSGSDTDRLYSAFAVALARLVPYRLMHIARIDNSQLVDLPVFDAGGKVRSEAEFSPLDVHHAWFNSRLTIRWDRDTEELPSFMSRGVTGGLVVPMRPKGQPIGAVVLELDDDESESTVHLAERAIEQLSLALDSAELYQQATERASRIQAQSNLANIVASSVDLRETFDAFAEEVRWLIPFERAVMLMVDRTTGLVERYASYPLEGEADSDPPPVSGSVVSRILDAGGPVALRRHTSGEAADAWSVFGHDVAELAAVAVRESGESTAVFALLHSGRADYDSMDLRALDEVSGLLSVTIDRQILFERAEYAARHDHLTGLANYRFLQEHLTELQDSFDGDHRTAVMVADMDGLKIYNDALGHEAGDRAIQRVAEELQHAVRSEDLVARTGGDEFVVVMENVSEEDAGIVTQRVHDALRNVHEEIDNAPVPVRVSIGLAMAPDDGSTPGELLEAADRAMYAAKFSGGDRTRSAAETGDQRETPRTLRRRGNRVMDLLIRSAVDGASGPERIALALGQRYAVAVAIGRGLPMDTTDSLRMLVAAEAAHHVEAPLEYADQATALMLLDGLKVQWEEQVGAGRLELASLLPAAVRLAWEQIPAPDGPGLSADEALQILREDPAYDLSPEVMEILAETARTAEFERRRQRPDAA
jgi:diguanylate cyclase (GGDEF)-like protein